MKIFLVTQLPTRSCVRWDGPVVPSFALWKENISTFGMHINVIINVCIKIIFAHSGKKPLPYYKCSCNIAKVKTNDCNASRRSKKMFRTSRDIRIKKGFRRESIYMSCKILYKTIPPRHFNTGY